MAEANENEENEQSSKGEVNLDAAPVQVPRSNPNEFLSDESNDSEEDEDSTPDESTETTE
jgi:hypothetical protein